MTGKGGAGGRATDLDLYKTMLVWGMIAAHCIQLLVIRPKLPAQVFSDFINVITFSGFLFAFGLGIGLSSGSKARPWAQRLRPVLLLLLATYVSELAFVVLVERKVLSPDLLVSLFSLTRLYGWSEFLASFFVLYLVIALARPVLVWIASQWWTLGLAVLACFGSTWVVYDGNVPLAATIVGTHDFASFPLLAYLPWFLVGIYVSRHPKEPGLIAWVLALAGTAAFAWVLWRTGELPGRFPPTIVWVAGPALPLLIYLSLARLVSRALPVPGLLLATGRHVLAALLVSNLAIFGLRRLFGANIGGGWNALWLWAAIMLGVTLWCALLDRRQRAAT